MALETKCMPFPVYLVDKNALLHNTLKQIIMLIIQGVAIEKKNVLEFFLRRKEHVHHNEHKI